MSLLFFVPQLFEGRMVDRFMRRVSIAGDAPFTIPENSVLKAKGFNYIIYIYNLSLSFSSTSNSNSNVSR